MRTQFLGQMANGLLASGVIWEQLGTLYLPLQPSPIVIITGKPAKDIPAGGTTEMLLTHVAVKTETMRPVATISGELYLVDGATAATLVELRWEP